MNATRSSRVHLTDSEFSRLLEMIVTPDVFAAARTLRERNSFERDDGTPLFYTLVNVKDWCKNCFEVVNPLRINTDNSHHRYDAVLLINVTCYPTLDHPGGRFRPYCGQPGPCAADRSISSIGLRRRIPTG